jgi:hypothetical protein
MVLPMALAGCKLIDQTTFAPDPEPAPPAQIAASVRADSRTPLLTIRYDVPDPAYEDLLRYALNAAETRDPDIAYDVVAVGPGGGTTAAVEAAQLRRPDAVAVMRSMMTMGVPDNRIRLGARTDPQIQIGEVRVYVR